jgi:transposase-like protein
MAKRRDRAKELLWREHLAAWRRSGQSVRDYCVAKGLSQPSFYAWRRTLSERAGRGRAQAERGGSPTSNTALAGVASFVPVRLVEDTPSPGTVEVVLRGGRLVRVTAGFAADTLREVVAALEELPC